MTYAIQSGQAVASTSIWQRLSDLTTSLAQHRTYRSTVRELSVMSYRDLNDIGIHPADIHAIARQATYGA